MDDHWWRGALDRDPSPSEGATTWRWERGRWQRESCSRRREWPDDLSRVGPVAGRTARRAAPAAHDARTRSREGPQLRIQECPWAEYEWAARDERFTRWGRQRSAVDPQLEGCHWEACRMEGQARDANGEPGRPTTDPEPPGEG